MPKLNKTQNYVFFSRKKVIQVWNNVRVKVFIFKVNYSFFTPSLTVF